jgi:pimeloyl-ACP methyl ester carboxylesterase
MSDHSLPGRFVDTGTYTAYLEESGSGTPTVVLISGLGDNALLWRLVQPKVATFAHVVSYDRAGLGSSTPSSAPRTSANIAAELHALLVAAQLPQPYVLVGHSMGGVHARAFIRAYPDEVVGLVLVDSSHEQQIDHLPDKLIEDDRIRWETEFVPLLSMSKAELQAHMAKQRRAVLPPEVFEIDYARVQPSIYEAIAGEYQSYQAMRGSAPPESLGDLPLIVLTNVTPTAGESAETSAGWASFWPKLQVELAGLSTQSEHRQIVGSHYLQVDNPAEVVTAIHDMVERVGPGG